MKQEYQKAEVKVYELDMESVILGGGESEIGFASHELTGNDDSSIEYQEGGL